MVARKLKMEGSLAKKKDDFPKIRDGSRSCNQTTHFFQGCTFTSQTSHSLKGILSWFSACAGREFYKDLVLPLNKWNLFFVIRVQIRIFCVSSFVILPYSITISTRSVSTYRGTVLSLKMKFTFTQKYSVQHNTFRLAIRNIKCNFISITC
jgi:hypothetical protein